MSGKYKDPKYAGPEQEAEVLRLVHEWCVANRIAWQLRPGLLLGAGCEAYAWQCQGAPRRVLKAVLCPHGSTRQSPMSLWHKDTRIQARVYDVFLEPFPGCFALVWRERCDQVGAVVIPLEVMHRASVLGTTSDAGSQNWGLVKRHSGKPRVVQTDW